MKRAVFPARVAMPLAAACAACAMSTFALTGCARSAEERQLDSMRSEIDHLVSSRDRADELALVPEGEETAEARPEKLPVPPGSPPTPAAVAANAAQSVTLGTEDEGGDEYADTEDQSPRPNIRVLGSPRAGRGGWRGDDQVEQTGDGPGAADSDQVHTLDPAAKRAYDAALALVNARQYPQALDAFAAFLVKWPDHPYADNAMYWRGEAYFARGDYGHAAEQFEGVLARFPGGNKVPDALLKLGLCAQKTGDAARAKEYFDRLAQQYPQSEAARHIPPVAPSAAPAASPAATPRGPAPEDHK